MSTNPEGHTEANAVAQKVISFPIEDRPIEVIYNNQAPHALSEIKIFGKTLSPLDFAFNAKEGTVTLKYSFHRVRFMVEDE